MSKGVHFTTHLLQMATDWRRSAGELREIAMGENGKVPFPMEVAAETLEICAQRLEDKVREHHNGTHETVEEPSQKPAPACGPLCRGAPAQTTNPS